MSRGLVMAIIASFAVHAGILILGDRLPVGAEGERGVRGTLVMASSLLSVAVPGLAAGPALRKVTARKEQSSAVVAEHPRESPATADDVSTQDELGSLVRDGSGESDAYSPFGARYFKGAELTERPRPVDRVELTYPVSGDLQDLDRSGSIILRLLIAETGGVDRVLVESSELPEIFHADAMRRFVSARFLPGKIGELAVKSQIRVEVTFHSGS